MTVGWRYRKSIGLAVLLRHPLAYASCVRQVLQKRSGWRKTGVGAFRHRLAFDPPILLNMVLITIIHFNSLAQPLAILLSVPSALVGVVLGLLITGVPLGLMTLLVALTRIVVRVLYSIVFGFARKSATLTEPTATLQPSRT